jgi:hypothetical protein
VFDRLHATLEHAGHAPIAISGNALCVRAASGV